MTEPGSDDQAAEVSDETDRMDTSVPPDGFDPEHACQNDLDRYRLPRKPDPKTQPTLTAAWRRMFAPPLNWVRAEIAEEVEVLSVRVPEVRAFLPTTTTRFEDSKNWCGAEIVPHGGNRFVQIYGEWTVPAPFLPPPYDQVPEGEKYKSSTWIGLDGDRLYLNSSLPQVGTGQDLTIEPSSTDREYYAWFQWWARDLTKFKRKKIKTVDIQSGMSVMGLVWAFNPTHVAIVFRNFAPLNQITIFVEHAPKVKLSNGIMVRPTISGATAEWIMERPTIDVINATTLEPFPSYTAVRFNHCVAGMARTAGLPTSEEVLKAPRFKRLFEVASDAPWRTRIISRPERINTTSFAAHYGGF